MISGLACEVLGLLHSGMIRVLAILGLLSLCACQSGAVGPYQPRAGQGQYVRPAYLNPAPVPRLPPVDACRSQLYQGLVGQPEGAIFIPGLPGAKRVLKPAFNEDFNYSSEDMFYNEPPFVEVKDYLPGQSLYAPSILTPGSLLATAQTDLSRLTIELDVEGLVQEIRCG